MRYLIIESATGDELGSIDTDPDNAVADLIWQGMLDGEPGDYDVDEDHPIASDGDLVILGPDFPELVLEPEDDDEYDDEDEADDEDDDD